MDATLTYMALRNWNAPFDNATHNYFVWRRAGGRWGMIPWDFDAEFSNSGQSIYWDEQTNPQPDTLRGPQWVKDSFFKTFREEFRQKLFLLNNTLLHPTNLSALGFGAIRGFAESVVRYARPMDNTDFELSWRKKVVTSYVVGALTELGRAIGLAISSTTRWKVGRSSWWRLTSC